MAGTPYPAVRESPSTTILTGLSSAQTRSIVAHASTIQAAATMTMGRRVSVAMKLRRTFPILVSSRSLVAVKASISRTRAHGECLVRTGTKGLSDLSRADARRRQFPLPIRLERRRRRVPSRRAARKKAIRFHAHPKDCILAGRRGSGVSLRISSYGSLWNCWMLWDKWPVPSDLPTGHFLLCNRALTFATSRCDRQFWPA